MLKGKVIWGRDEVRDGEDHDVELDVCDGRVIIAAYNEGGLNGTRVDLYDLIVAIHDDAREVYNVITNPAFIEDERERRAAQKKADWEVECKRRDAQQAHPPSRPQLNPDMPQHGDFIVFKDSAKPFFQNLFEREGHKG